MKRILLLILFPSFTFADFTSTDSANLASIEGNSSTASSTAVALFNLFNDRHNDWAGNFAKTVGDAARRYTLGFAPDGWYTLVKAMVSAIQADVGRIYTAVSSLDNKATTANTTLSTISTHTEDIRDRVENMEGNVSSIKDTADSIDTTITGIKTDTASISSIASRIIDSWNYLLDTTWSWQFHGIDLKFMNGHFPRYGRLSLDDVTGNFSSFLQVPSDDTWFDLVEFYLAYMSYAHSQMLSYKVSGLYRLSEIQYTEYAATNLLENILNTNSYWFAKIYDRLPTNLTVTVSNVTAVVSNDWRHTATPFLASTPVLNNRTPAIGRDVSLSYMLNPPDLTGDFKQDVILLLAYAQNVAASDASVNMDILTNLQVVAGSILSSVERVKNAKSSLEQTNRDIADEGQSHANDLESIRDVYDLKNNEGVRQASLDLSNLPSKLSDLNVGSAPSSGTLTIPAFSFANSGFHEMQINVDYSEYLPFFNGVRNVFALFWFGIVAYLLVLFLRLGIQFLGRIAAYIDPTPFANNPKAAAFLYA